MGREIALDLLEGFLPDRNAEVNTDDDNSKDSNPKDINHMDPMDPVNPNFWNEIEDNTKILVYGYFRDAHKELFGDTNNPYFDVQPLIVHCCISFYYVLYERKIKEPNKLIPEHWLLDLYGLADEVRKKHRRMESAVLDLKAQLDVPPILADVVARDVLDEIETVDPYLLSSDDDNHNNIMNESSEDGDDDEDQDEDLQNKYDNLQIEMEEKMALIAQYENQIQEYEQEREEQKSNNEQQLILDKLQEEFARFKQKCNETNLQEMMKEEPEKLLDELEILSYQQFVDKVMEFAKSSGEYLQNINGIISSISSFDSK